MNIYAFSTYMLVTAFTPGPNNISSMSNASRYGLRKSYPYNLGIFCGFSIVMILCTLFSATMLRLIPRIKPLMLILGAGYILWLAWKTWKSSSEISSRNGKDATFLSGFLLQFINPKIYIYGITSMSTYILPSYSSLPVLTGFAVLLAFVGFSSTICWAIFGSVFARLFENHAKLINGIMAILLIYCSVSLFV